MSKKDGSEAGMIAGPQLGALITAEGLKDLRPTLWTKMSKRRYPVACPSCLRPIRRSWCAACKQGLHADVDHVYRSTAFELAYFSWVYGFRHAQDAREGRSKVSYYLPEPSDALIYLASIAAAGVVGNFTYDVFKRLVKSARDHLKRLLGREDREQGLRSKLITDIRDLDDAEFLDALLALAKAHGSLDRRIHLRASRKLERYLSKKIHGAVKRTKK